MARKWRFYLFSAVVFLGIDEYDACANDPVASLGSLPQRHPDVQSNFWDGGSDQVLSDSGITSKWYSAIQDGVQYLMVDSNNKPDPEGCSTYYPIYLQGTHPSIHILTETPLAAVACKREYFYPCSTSYKIQIRKCGNQVQYYLGPTEEYNAYCFHESNSVSTTARMTSRETTTTGRSTPSTRSTSTLTSRQTTTVTTRWDTTSASTEQTTPTSAYTVRYSTTSSVPTSRRMSTSTTRRITVNTSPEQTTPTGVYTGRSSTTSRRSETLTTRRPTNSLSPKQTTGVNTGRYSTTFIPTSRRSSFLTTRQATTPLSSGQPPTTNKDTVRYSTTVATPGESASLSTSDSKPWWSSTRSVPTVPQTSKILRSSTITSTSVDGPDVTPAIPIDESTKPDDESSQSSVIKEKEGDNNIIIIMTVCMAVLVATIIGLVAIIIYRRRKAKIIKQTINEAVDDNKTVYDAITNVDEVKAPYENLDPRPGLNQIKDPSLRTNSTINDEKHVYESAVEVDEETNGGGYMKSPYEKLGNRSGVNQTDYSTLSQYDHYQRLNFERGQTGDENPYHTLP